MVQYLQFRILEFPLMAFPNIFFCVHPRVPTDMTLDSRNIKYQNQQRTCSPTVQHYDMETQGNLNHHCLKKSWSGTKTLARQGISSSVFLSIIFTYLHHFISSFLPSKTPLDPQRFPGRKSSPTWGDLFVELQPLLPMFVRFQGVRIAHHYPESVVERCYAATLKMAVRWGGSQICKLNMFFLQKITQCQMMFDDLYILMTSYDLQFANGNIFKYLLVGGFKHLEKYESQMGWWHSQIHQPDNFSWEKWWENDGTNIETCWEIDGKKTNSWNNFSWDKYGT